jgi:hypothetical protein
MNDLQKDFDVKIVNSGQSSFHTKYEANLRYKKYVTSNFPESSVFNTPEITSKYQARGHSGQQNIKNTISIVKDLMSDRTVALIIDDSRETKPLSSELYKMAQDSGCLVFANFHGNMPIENIPVHYGLSGEKKYDHIFVLGDYDKENIENFGFDRNIPIPAGIPENDELEKLDRSNDIILVIPNFILKRELGGYSFDHCKKPLLIDSEVMKKIKLLELQQKLGKKVVFKLKHRMSSPYQQEVEVIKKNVSQGLDYEVIHHTDSEKSLIARAACVLTYGSTMTFKSIQMGIPTVVFKDWGHVGNFIEYKGLISVGDSYDFIFDEGFMSKERDRFLRKTLKGGTDFTSSKFYIESLYQKLGVSP